MRRRSRIVFVAIRPSLVFDETGVNGNCIPSLAIAVNILRLNRRLVSSSFSSIAVSRAIGLLDHLIIWLTVFFGRRSILLRR